MEATLRSYVPNPTSLEPRKSEEITPAPGVGLKTMQLGTNGPLPVVVGRSTLNPEEPEGRQPPLITNKKERIAESDYSGASLSPSEKAFHETQELHQHQNALQRSRTKSWKCLHCSRRRVIFPRLKFQFLTVILWSMIPSSEPSRTLLSPKRRVRARGYTISSSLIAATLKTSLNCVTIFHPRRVIKKRNG